MVHLATAPSAFEARLLAARLGAEGMLWQLRGESSVYPMGSVDVLVEADELDRARELLLVAELDALGLPEWDAHPAAGEAPRRRGHTALLAVVALLAIGLLALRSLGGL